LLPAEVIAWNRAETPYPRGKTIGQLFGEQAGRTPDSVALIAGDRSFSYRELEAKANQLANYLQACGVGPETLVGVSMERSHQMLIALLATLKSGGAYVPIDPSYPRQRISHVVADAQVRILLTTANSSQQLPKVASRIVSVDGEAKAIAAQSAEPPVCTATSQNLAYVIYTSGSTGNPKGVMVEHSNVVNFFAGMDRAIGSDPGVWLAVTSMAFDISVLELLWTLTRGFTVVLHGDEGDHTIAEEIERHRVTHFQSTPSLARVLSMGPSAPIAFGSLKKLLLGGEALPPTLIAQLRPLIRGEIYNMYGPTETTIWSTVFPITEAFITSPIGRPIANTQTYILDSELRRVPTGEPGELYIGGEGVARGYLRRPDLTAERFLPDPFLQGNRIYKTGDVARFLPDGNIEYLGRTDFQVKIRGYRIELGEIEASLERHPFVQQAVVMAREDKPGDKRLVAYLTKKPAPIAKIAGHELKSFVSEMLPSYMVPATFVFLDKIPLTSNGKIDRKALPAPSNTAASAQIDREPARSEIERTIEQVWKDALGVDHVGLDENFFDLGAHSLLVAEVHASLQERLGREIPLVDLFHFPCIAALATHLGGGSIPHPSTSSKRVQRRLAARQDRVLK